jgi:3-isopropylmalate/(R)-2-methylmalate dehydratase large subunit
MQFFRTDLRYSHEYVTAMAEVLVREHAATRPLTAPDRILLFEDHLTALARTPNVDPEAVANAQKLARTQEGFAAARRLRLHGRIGEWSEGICHIVVTEQYAGPRELIVGSDSHTCHVGALGCLAVGVGTTDIANAWVSGDVLLPVPRNLLIMAVGQLKPGVTEKDLMLYLLAMPSIRAGAAIGAVVEFAGEAISALDVDARCTLTNMTAEMGAVSGIVAADDQTARFLIEHRMISRAAALALCVSSPSDPDAFDDVIRLDVGAIAPMVSLPGDPGNAMPVTEADVDINIQRAYGGSCTAAKPRDMDMYAAVLGAALREGRRVHQDVQFFIQVGSQAVLAYCTERGYLDTFARAGATLLGPSCGACINAGPGVSTTSADVAISAQNRNFPGRSGPGRLYLASPLTVAASAVEGRITQYKPRR